MPDRLDVAITRDRVKMLADEKGLALNAVAESAGVKYPTLWKALTGARKFRPEELAAIAKKLGTTVDFLLGETDDPNPGMRFGHTNYGDAPPEMPNINRQKQEIVSNVAPINLAHMLRIKVLPRDFKVCCGNGIDWGSEAIEFEETLVLPLADLARRYSDGDILAVYAEGDSMEPKVGDGDLVLFVPHEKEVISAGMMMVVNYNGRMIIRGVIENNRKQITLRAMNKEYEDIIVTPDDDFTICGRVVRIFSLREPVPVL